MYCRRNWPRWVLLAALVCVGPGTAGAEEPLFPDKNLESAVRQYVFAKRDNDMPLVEADVKDISTIVAKKKGIQNLTGLEKCRSLALLDLEGNEVVDLTPIKGLPRLQSLTLAKNKIVDLAPLAESKALQLLDLADNQVESVAPLSGLSSMTTLYLANNKVKDAGPLGSLSKLWSLDLANNQVATLEPIGKLKNLTSLHLEGNGVAEITALKGLTELSYLFLQNNKITDLSVLVEMAKGDKEKRFAPFWNIYLTGNALSDKGDEQIKELKDLGGRITWEKKAE